MHATDKHDANAVERLTTTVTAALPPNNVPTASDLIRLISLNAQHDQSEYTVCSAASPRNRKLSPVEWDHSFTTNKTNKPTKPKETGNQNTTTPNNQVTTRNHNRTSQRLTCNTTKLRKSLLQHDSKPPGDKSYHPSPLLGLRP